MTSEPKAPGPETDDPREFLESEPAYENVDQPEDEEESPIPGPLVVTDPTGAPRDPDLGVDEQSPLAD